jgi:Flp pilus assembly protein TadD
MLLGTIYDMQKKFDLAEKHYRAALEIKPDFAPAANNLAFLLAGQNKDMEEALTLAQKAKELLPDDASIMDTLGWVYYKKGLYDSAISEFRDSMAKLPRNPVVRYHLGLAYLKKGNKAGAREQLSRALELSNSFDGADDARKVLAELKAS